MIGLVFCSSRCGAYDTYMILNLLFGERRDTRVMGRVLSKTVVKYFTLGWLLMVQTEGNGDRTMKDSTIIPNHPLVHHLRFLSRYNLYRAMHVFYLFSTTRAKRKLANRHHNHLSPVTRHIRRSHHEISLAQPNLQKQPRTKAIHINTVHKI